MSEKESFLEYTGHCLRRTLATLFVDEGTDIMCLKRHGGVEIQLEESMTDEEDIIKKCTT